MIGELGMKARNVVVELMNGKTCRMDFDMAALANAEGVYEDFFGRKVGVDVIISELVEGRARALMAMTYGAMVSAQEKITWQEFGKSIYTFENYQRLSDVVSDALVAMMGGGEETAGETKNADSRGGK